MVLIAFDIKKKSLSKRGIIFGDGNPMMGRIRISRSPEGLFLSYIFVIS